MSMVTPSPSPRVESPARVAGWLGLGVILAVATAIWWRNHDILSDLYDYSSIIAAAGKVEAGLKPYVDFRSTMQSSTYLLNRGAELVAGRSYQGLTRGGLAFILLGATALFVLWRRALGTGGGLAMTAAVTWSGLNQHVVVFYNPVGILCLSLVVAGVAADPRLWGGRRWDRVIVLTALVLGGMNKLNFQVLALALAGVLVLEAWAAGRLGRREALASLGVLAGAGVVAPWLIELAWTGATPAQWFDNVVRLAGERIDYMERLADASVYLGPAHDLHFHIPFKQLTAVGLVVLGLVGWLAWRSSGGPGAAARRRWLAVYVVGGGVGCVLLTITNVESIALTSLALPVAAAGLWAVTGARESPPRWAWLIPVAGCLWALDGGTAAWRGSRILFGRADANRSVFVRLENAPPALRYLEGTRLDANLHRSLLLVARELERHQGKSGSMRGVLFGPTFEWLERAYPEAILRGMPVWYHVGTALREDDGDWLVQQLREQKVDRVLAHPNWESWPESFREYLQREFQSVPLGSVARIRERIGTEQFTAGAGSFQVGEPLALIERTGSNLHLAAMPPPAGFAFLASPWGDTFGHDGGWRWEWPGGIAIAEGTVVLHAQDDGRGPLRLRARVMTAEANGPAEELWSAEAEVDAGRPWARLPFRITPYGRPVFLQVTAVTAQPDSSWTAGIRDVRISQTVGDGGTPPPSVIVGGPPRRVVADGGEEHWVRGNTDADDAMSAWTTAPVEYWAQRRAGGAEWRFRLDTEPAAEAGGTPPVVMLLWYRGGRLELLSQQAVEAGPARELAFKGWMPEPGGWIGVAIRPLERGKPFATRVRAAGWGE